MLGVLDTLIFPVFTKSIPWSNNSRVIKAFKLGDVGVVVDLNRLALDKFYLNMTYQASILHNENFHNNLLYAY